MYYGEGPPDGGPSPFPFHSDHSPAFYHVVLFQGLPLPFPLQPHGEGKGDFFPRDHSLGRYGMPQIVLAYSAGSSSCVDACESTLTTRWPYFFFSLIFENQVCS